MSGFVAIGPCRPSTPHTTLALHVGGIVALAVVFAASDAFGSDRLSLERQLLMFGVVSLLLVGQASLAADAARRVVRSARAAPPAAIIAALAATLGLMTVELELLKATPVLPYRHDPLPEFALFLLPVVVPVSALVIALKWQGPAVGAPSASGRPAPAYDQGAAAGDFIVGRADPVLRIQAVDHYLHVWTRGGRALVRGRLSDALREQPPGAGFQPHRSWWVAISEIERIERRGRDFTLRLRDGERVPVARSRAARVRDILDRRDCPRARSS
jgi:hypothetical protein